jgi:hypothetical protein
MYTPSLTTVLSVAFLGYMGNSMWNIIQLYIPPSCPDRPADPGAKEVRCVTNLVTPSTPLSLLMFSTTSPRPRAGSDLSFLHKLDVVADDEKEEEVTVKIPRSVSRNGSLYLAVFAVPSLGKVN